MFAISDINSPVFMVYSAHQNKRAVNAQQRENGSNQKRKVSFVMAESSISQFSFLGQVAELAPTISNLLNSQTARITAAVSSHDVTGGYGRGFTFYSDQRKDGSVMADYSYVGKSPCGCVAAICTDDKRACGDYLKEFIELGLTVERVTTEYAINHFLEDCDRCREPKQVELFQETGA